MSGLFRRARAIRTRMELLGDLQNTDYVVDISEAERERVLSGIDSMLMDERHRIDAGALRFIPKKRSFVLPLMLNLGAILVLGIGALIMMNIFDRGETALTKPDTGLNSAEGRVLQKLRQDAEAELSVKEQEINDIRGLMADLENQKALLGVQTESRIAERETELRREFDAQMAAEQARLSGTGVSGENLSAAMAAYESEVRNRLEASLTETRAQAAADQERRLAEIETQRRTYEQQIEASDSRRKDLQQELDARNAELVRLEKQQTAVITEASRELDDLRARQQRDKNITDQILAFYGRVGAARTAGDTDAALKALDSLELYLREDSIRGTAVVENRREIDAFLTGALRRLIALESQAPEPETVVDDGSAAVLAGITAGAVAGNRLAETGNLASAETAWRNAFSAIPELRAAFDTALKNAAVNSASEVGRGAAGGAGAVAGAAVVTAADLAAARNQGLAEGVQQGRLAASADAATAVERAREEGFNRGVARGYNDGRNESARALSTSADEISRLKGLLEALITKLGVFRNQYRQALARSEGDLQDSQETMVGLLDQKLIIKSGLDPSLYRNLDTYTDATGDVRELEGREAIYTEILDFLSELEIQ